MLYDWVSLCISYSVYKFEFYYNYYTFPSFLSGILVSSLLFYGNSLLDLE